MPPSIPIQVGQVMPQPNINKEVFKKEKEKRKHCFIKSLLVSLMSVLSLLSQSLQLLALHYLA